ncbi:MAG TPA: hypothetical protein VF068_14530 [Rubrobacter sp.]
MYQHYELRRRASRRTRALRLLIALLVAVLFATAIITILRWGKVERPVAEEDGIKQVSTVDGTHLAVYDGTGWKTQFWTGMNLGATLPGHEPGEVAPTKEDYLRWFPEIKKMNVDVLRVYTILNPDFYEALHEYNSTQEEPLWVIQGVWSPEEELTGDDLEGRNAYKPEITKIFRDEITDAVHVVHGDAELPERPGHASGDFDADISEYMLGWIVGTEWFPLAVQKTDEANRGIEPFSGEYFHSTDNATPFESWSASMLDKLAQEEMKYGWQHPVALSNWPTTDPLSHPDEANDQEDLVSVDPMHIEPTSSWKAGYFASYHIYPAFPDFMRYEEKYQNYSTPDGTKDPYAGYLHELRAHHEGIPLMASEYGTSSARGMAHRGALGRDQGFHTEEEQGKINADLLDDIHNEGLDGGILFSWQDEWFKFAWNTGDLEIPGRRPMWLNRLTNEQNYGVIATEPGESIEDTIHLDGKTDDWEKRTGGPDGLRDIPDWMVDRIMGRVQGVEEQGYEDFDLGVTHDEAYLYLLLKKKEGPWRLPGEDVDVGFGSLPGGSDNAEMTPGVDFPDGGIQFLLQIKGDKDSHLRVNSAYDQHTWLYGKKLDYIPDPVIEDDPQKGVFLPWKLALNRPLTLPQTKRKIPFEDYEVGKMKPGITDPSNPDYDSLADWYAKGDVLEVRIPWTMLGYTDPSTLRVWDYPYEADGIKSVKVEGLRIYPTVRNPGQTSPEEIKPLAYTWDGWDQPTYHERKKQSYYFLKKEFERHDQVAKPQ